jgi:anthranilate phosphoribosyltransferase
MRTIMAGEATSAQIGAFLVALRLKGETVTEIAAAASVMREHVHRVEHGLERILDTCGTGGDGADTFNISTTVAFVCAGAGVPIAKHGNRAVSSRSGSADVLEKLGVCIDLPPSLGKVCLAEVGFAFLFAPSHHPAMRHVAGPRREIGVRSMMNLLGPLTNPAMATHQLVGLYDPTRVVPVAQVLADLGAKRAVVVHGAGGLDEVSPAGDTHVAIGGPLGVAEKVSHPSHFGLEPIDLSVISGGDAQQNAEILRGVLSGEQGPYRMTTLLNAAWAIYAAEAASSPEEGFKLAAQSIDSGKALAVLKRLIDWTQSKRKTEVSG